MSKDERNVEVCIGNEETIAVSEDVWRQVDDECRREFKKRGDFLGCSPLPKEIHGLLRKKYTCTDEVR